MERGVIGHVSSGVLAPKRSEPLPERLLFIHSNLVELVKEYSPAAAAVEDIFFSRYPQGALKLGHARGVALLAAAQVGVEIHSYPPAKVKRALSGHGRADKAQIARLVTMLLKLSSPPLEDQADALSLAICHAATSGQLGVRSR